MEEIITVEQIINKNESKATITPPSSQYSAEQFLPKTSGEVNKTVIIGDEVFENIESIIVGGYMYLEYKKVKQDGKNTR